MILARDVMTPNPMCIDADMDVQQAVEFFLNNHVSSAPVKDATGIVIGQLPELELMRAFVKRKVQPTAPHRVGDYRELIQAPHFVRAHASLPDVVAALIHSPLHRLLVLDSHSHLEGIISPKDVLRLLNSGESHPGSMVTRLRDLEAMVKDLDKKLQETSLGLARYQQIFDTSPYMMHSADRNGKILLANPPLVQALGYQPGELIGKTIFDIYPATLHEAIRKGLEEVVHSGHHDVTYSSLISKTGKVLRVEVISSALRDAKGMFVGTVTISRPMDGDSLLRALHGVFDPK